MVKIINKYKEYIFSHKIDTLNTSIEFYEKYLPLLIQKHQDKNNERKNNKLLKNEDELIPFKIKAGIEADSILESKEYELKKINDKFYWKKRALIQSKKRKLSKDRNQEQKEKITSNYEMKLNEIEKLHKVKLLQIVQNYKQVDNIDSAISAYNHKKEELTKSFLKYSNQLEMKLDKFIKSKTNFYTYKVTTLKKQRETIQNKLNLLISSNGKANELDNNVLLKVDGLSMRFGGLKAVDNLSFEVKKGEIFGLIGPNGAGKTTVFNCITRFYKYNEGVILFRNRKNEVIDLGNYKVHNVIKEGIVRTFQNVELIWELSVLDNLLVAGHTLYRTKFMRHLFSTPRLRQEEDVMRKKAYQILEKLNLVQYQHMLPLGLPYGILKKVELARTLMVNPSLIILDEPAAGLNDVEKIALAKLIKEIRDEYRTTIFLVEHDMGLVMNICDNICAISFGKKLAIGTPSFVQKDKAVKEAYLGGD